MGILVNIYGNVELFYFFAILYINENTGTSCDHWSYFLCKDHRTNIAVTPVKIPIKLDVTITLCSFCSILFML